MTLHLSHAWTMEPPASAVPPARGPGVANAGVYATILPHAEPRHLRDMAEMLLARAQSMEEAARRA